MSTHSWDGITLPGDMLWIDENSDLLAQQEIRTVTGKLVLFSKALTAGRPVTLSGHPVGNWSGAWVEWSTVEALLAMVTPGRIMSVEYGERPAMLVTWSGTKPVDYRAVRWEFEPKASAHKYTLELRGVLVSNITLVTP